MEKNFCRKSFSTSPLKFKNYGKWDIKGKHSIFSIGHSMRQTQMWKKIRKIFDGKSSRGGRKVFANGALSIFSQIGRHVYGEGEQSGWRSPCFQWYPRGNNLSGKNFPPFPSGVLKQTTTNKISTKAHIGKTFPPFPFWSFKTNYDK